METMGLLTEKGYAFVCDKCGWHGAIASDNVTYKHCLQCKSELRDMTLEEALNLGFIKSTSYETPLQH